MGLEQQRVQQAEYHGGGDARGGAGDAADECADQAVAVHRFNGAHGQGIAKARQRYGRTCPGEVGQGLVDAQRCQYHPGYHEQHEYTCVGQLGAHDQQLADVADQPADHECLYKHPKGIHASLLSIQAA